MRFTFCSIVWLNGLALILCLMSGCAYLGPYSPLAQVEQSLIYQPELYPEGDWRPGGREFEDAWFEAEDGTRLHGWYCDCPDPKAVALFMHGNSGNITSRADTLRVLKNRHGLAVMTFDYRGFGRSEGTPSEEGILQDARAARRWLAQRTGVEERDILLMGRSLGGAVAVDLAAKDGARGLVLASTFTSLPDVGAYHAPWAVPRLNMTTQFNSLAKIKDYYGPLLQSHGDADRTVPYILGVKVYQAAPGQKRFITIKGGQHNDLQTEEYRRALDYFIGTLRPDDTVETGEYGRSDRPLISRLPSTTASE